MKHQSSQAFTLIELLVVISIIAILAGIALPVFSGVQERGQQTKALSNAKQIALACKLYAQDHDGRFPTKALDQNLDPTGADVTDSNTAFAQLVPDYVQTESIFALGKSKWSDVTPDERVDNPPQQNATETLKKGENHWAYVLNLTDTSNPAFPLIADGFVEGSTPGDPTYTDKEDQKGGVWRGKKAVVIRADTSGTLENVDRATFTVQRRTSSGKDNLFKSSDDWLGASQTAVNPK
jgi:prepilin-type N-terminal cleavage/methylation domain-containing protein